LTVFAQLDPQHPGVLGAFVVETAWDGIKVGQEMPKMGLKASSTAAIKFSNVRVPKENLLGQPGDGFKIAMTILNFGRLALGAASSGVMKLSLKDMAKRAERRVQFGVPIHRFQLIQEKIVKAKLNSYAVAAMTEMTAAMLARNPFATVAMLARIEGFRRAGHGIEEDLKLLELFSERARKAARRNFRLLPTREERLNDEIMPFIIPGEQKATKVSLLESKVHPRQLA